MSMGAFGACALHPTSAVCPKPCWGLGLPPQGGQSEQKEPSSECLLPQPTCVCELFPGAHLPLVP